MPNKKNSPFALALAARRKEIPEESLTGAAKRLYDDASLTQVALEGYAKVKPIERPRQVGKIHRTFKRG